MLSLTRQLRGKLSRALIISTASALMFGVSVPMAAQAAEPAPATVAPLSPSLECSGYSYTHHSYRYYQYCYDWVYKTRGDQNRGNRWYESYELYYWYVKNGHRDYGSCTFYRNFGYHHPSGPWKTYCPSF